MEEAGVWDEHVKLSLDPPKVFCSKLKTDAFASINGKQAQRAALRNGDIIELGSLKLQFWLSEAPRVDCGFAKRLSGTIITAVCLAQVALVYWLIKAE